MTVRECQAEMRRRIPEAAAIDVDAAVLAVLSNTQLGRFGLDKVEARVRAILMLAHH